VGGREKFQKENKILKKKLGGGWKKNKVPKKKIEIMGKNNWEVGGEKIKLQKKLRSRLIRAKKGPKKKSNLKWHRDRKKSPINPSSIHVGALVGASSFWP
jgi:hypothetical protein